MELLKLLMFKYEHIRLRTRAVIIEVGTALKKLVTVSKNKEAEN